MKNVLGRDQIKPLIDKVEALFKEYEVKYEICGSYRRKSPLIGDVDVVVDCPIEQVKLILQTLLPTVINEGKKATELNISGVQFDFYHAEPHEWGSMIYHLTGSKEYNIKVRRYAKKKGFKLNQYGLFRGDERVAGMTEEEIFESLGLEFINPEDRHTSDSTTH